MADTGGSIQGCPRCGNSDMSQAVTAILAGQTHVIQGSQRSVGAAWTGSGVVPVLAGGTFSGSHQSELARMLDLPPPRPPSATMGCLGSILIALGLVFGGFTVWAVIVSSSDQQDTTEARQADDAPMLTAVVGATFFGGPPLIGGIVIVAASRRQRRRMPASQSAWRGAALVYQRLYYCARDHLVYDPANPDVVVDPVQTPFYAYQHATTG